MHLAMAMPHRILRYWLKGSKAGSVDTLIDGLPGFP